MSETLRDKLATANQANEYLGGEVMRLTRKVLDLERIIDGMTRASILSIERQRRMQESIKNYQKRLENQSSETPHWSCYLDREHEPQNHHAD